MPMKDRSTRATPGIILPPPDLKSETYKSALDEKKDFLNATIEITRSKDEQAIHQYKARSYCSQARLASSQAAVAKGDSAKQLRQERQILIREKTEVDDEFDCTVTGSRIEVLERVIMEFYKPPAPAHAGSGASASRGR